VFQTGSENSSGNQTNANTVYVVRFRYNSSLSINTSCRLLWDSKELYIMSIRNVDNRNEFYELRCGHSYEV
jgi:head-tail adaptor